MDNYQILQTVMVCSLVGNAITLICGLPKLKRWWKKSWASSQAVKEARQTDEAKVVVLYPMSGGQFNEIYDFYLAKGYQPNECGWLAKRTTELKSKYPQEESMIRAEAEWKVVQSG